MKRILCLALVLLMLLPMAIACKKDEQPIDTVASDVADATEETGPVNLLDTIPSANYGGKEFIITVTKSNNHQLEVEAKELTGETKNDTVYQWLETINARYGVVVKPNVPDGDFWTAINTEASSGSVTTAIYGHNAYELHRPVSSKVYKNWNSMGEMIDLDAARWDKAINDGITWNGVFFGLSGDLGYSKLQGAMAVYCNISLLDEVGYSLDTLYGMVNDKEWTFEAFEAIVKDFYVDTDYNNKKSAGDTFGFVATSGNAHDIWLEQFGISITSQNAETHELTPTLYNDENDTLLRELWSFLHENEGVYSVAGTGVSGPEDKFFSEGRAAMITTRLSYAAQFANDLGPDAYGILPAPLRNDEQEDHYTKLYDRFAVWGVSKNILDSDIDFIAHITDALCAESSQTVYPKYYDILLKQRYSKDPATAKMVDIIMKNVNIDCTFFFASYLEKYSYIAREVLWNSSAPDLASKYGSIANTLPAKLAELYALHTDN